MSTTPFIPMARNRPVSLPRRAPPALGQGTFAQRSAGEGGTEHAARGPEAARPGFFRQQPRLGRPHGAGWGERHTVCRRSLRRGTTPDWGLESGTDEAEAGPYKPGLP